MDLERQKQLAGIVEAPTEREKALMEKQAQKGEKLDEAGPFQGGYGKELSQPQRVIAELAQMLRDIKAFLRDGNTQDAAMMVDRAYSRAAGAKRDL